MITAARRIPEGKFEPPATPVRGKNVTPRTVDEVARHVMYQADRTFDGVVGNADVTRNGKLAAGLLAMTDATSLDQTGVRRIVTSFAGRDGVVDDTEFAKLADAVRRTTSRIPDSDTFPPIPRPDMAAAVRAMLSVGDATFDGVVDTRDVDAGSDMARAMMKVAGRTKLDVRGIEAAIKRMDAGTLDGKIEAYITGAYGWLNVYGRANLSPGDLGRAALTAFDSDQDMVLTTSDGIMAANLVRATGKSAVREADVARLYERYDVHGAGGSKGPDGRLDGREIATLP